MPEIGIRELKAHTSEVVREVREQGVSYIVTHRGHPAVLLIPVAGRAGEPLASVESDEAIWAEMMRLGEQMGREAILERTSAEVLSEMRG